MIKSQHKNTVNKHKQILSQSMINIDYTHIENNFVDFDRERLLFKMTSNEGPCTCVADFNDDEVVRYYPNKFSFNLMCKDPHGCVPYLNQKVVGLVLFSLHLSNNRF